MATAGLVLMGLGLFLTTTVQVREARAVGKSRSKASTQVARVNMQGHNKRHGLVPRARLPDAGHGHDPQNRVINYEVKAMNKPENHRIVDHFRSDKKLDPTPKIRGNQVGVRVNPRIPSK